MGAGQLIRDLLNAQIDRTGAEAYGTPDWRQKRQMDQVAAAKSEADLMNMPSPDEAAAQREAGMEATRALTGYREAQTGALGSRMQQADAAVALKKAQDDFARDPNNPANKLRVAQAQRALAASKLDEARADNPERFRSAGGGSGTLLPWTGTDPNTGEPVVIDRRTGQKIEGVAAPLTSDQRNMERYDITVPVQIQAVQDALDKVKTSAGTWGGAVKAQVPGTEAYYDAEGYNRLITGIAATAARAMGDNRISDTDRAAYAALYGVASRLVATPPGTELAQRLLDQAKGLIAKTQEARAGARAHGGMAPTAGATRPTPSAPATPAAASPGGPDPYEGRTATNKAGQKVIRRNGRWVPL